MFSFRLGIVLIIIIALAIIAVLAWLWKKMKKNPVAGGTIGFFIAVVVATGFFVIPSRAYVVTGNKQYSHYLVYSTSEYTTKNGNKIPIDTPQTKCTLINDTDQSLVIEEVIYGFGFPDNIVVEPHTHIVLDHSKIDYFFDEEPPNSIETKSSGSVSRLWLRTSKDFGPMEDAIDKESLENLQNLLNQ